VSGLADALGFLTVVGGGRRLSAESLRWFPVVGALIGLVVGGAWWSAAQVVPAPVAALVAVIVDLALTGMLLATGLGCGCASPASPPSGPTSSSRHSLPARPPGTPRRLEVMREPTVGAFAVVTGTTLLLARSVAFGVLPAHPLLVIAAWTASRSFAVVALAKLTMARDDGMAKTFKTQGGAWSGAVGFLAAAGVAVAWHPRFGVTALAVGVMAALAVSYLAVRRLGGVTGDTLGACIVIFETAALLAATAAVHT